MDLSSKLTIFTWVLCNIPLFFSPVLGPKSAGVMLKQNRSIWHINSAHFLLKNELVPYLEERMALTPEQDEILECVYKTYSSEGYIFFFCIKPSALNVMWLPYQDVPGGIFHLK